MKYLKSFEDLHQDLFQDKNIAAKVGDFVKIIKPFDELKKNQLYQIDSVDDKFAYIMCDDGELKSFRKTKSQIYRIIPNEKVDLYKKMIKYNL